MKCSITSGEVSGKRSSISVESVGVSEKMKVVLSGSVVELVALDREGEGHGKESDTSFASFFEFRAV